MNQNEECKGWIYSKYTILRKTCFREGKVHLFYHSQASNLDLPNLPGELRPCLFPGQRYREIDSQPRNGLTRKLCSLGQPQSHGIPVSYQLYYKLARAPRHLGSPHTNRWDFREPRKPRVSYLTGMQVDRKSRHSCKPSNLPICFVFDKFLLSQQSCKESL